MQTQEYKYYRQFWRWQYCPSVYSSQIFNRLTLITNNKPLVFITLTFREQVSFNQVKRKWNSYLTNTKKLSSQFKWVYRVFEQGNTWYYKLSNLPLFWLQLPVSLFTHSTASQVIPLHPLLLTLLLKPPIQSNEFNIGRRQKQCIK